MKASTGSKLSLVAALVGAAWASPNSTDCSAYTSILADGNANEKDPVDLGNAADAYVKAKAFVAGLTNAEKVSIITGASVENNVSNWDALSVSDGASGVNMHFFVSGFGTPGALTMSWNRELFEQQFRAIGDEFYGLGVQIVDGPVSSPLGRVPKGGRVPEGFSPEPYLNGIAMGKAVKGMNAAGVIAAGRHFLLNEQETNRSSSIRYSSNADDKTVQEVYAWPFADGVNNGMMAVMCGMNRVNGTLSCENDKLLSGYLKTDLGFSGMVFPDVQSQSTSYGSANAGLDYGSSSYWSASVIEAGIANGSMTQARLDDMAIRNVIGYYHVGLDDGKQPAAAGTTEYRNVRGDHGKLIRRSATESIVLLKNNNADGRGLPLNKPRTMSIFGAHAGPAMAGPNQAFSVQGTSSDIYQGHLATSGGSGQASFPYLITPHTAITIRAAEDGSMIWWLLNNTYTDSSSSMGPGGAGGNGGFAGGAGGDGQAGNFTGGPEDGNSSGTVQPGSNNFTTGPGAGSSPGGGSNGGGVNLGNLGSGTSVSPSIANYASGGSEVCLVFINANSGEGADRSELANDEQDTLVSTVADNCNNTIVVVNTVGPRILEAWVEHENVTAILYSGVLGQESGNAIADVLYGDVSPSGKLSYTIAKAESDYPASTCDTEECNFSEGVFLDYRWFEKQDIEPRYPFGFGLSYTNFTYREVSAATMNPKALASQYATGRVGPGGPADLWEEVITVKTSVQNSGPVRGREVVQLYVAFPEEAAQPPKVLRGFEKTAPLAPGQSAEVVFSVRRRDISYWDTVAQKWAIASGKYMFSVGASSQDIRGLATLTV
ncbi:putative beta-glucosidase D [Paramyrothecium foliicola]|nr:putative beta-glucosidase D [Paramyrothecium foliicola]